MTFHRLLPVLLLPACCLLGPAADNATGSASNSSGSRPTHGPGTARGGLSVDSAMIQRALYVLIGITGVGVLYFLVRAVRLKKPAQRKKYGLLSNQDDSVEMDAMESDEDDTLYEARNLRR
ncbi:protein FAM174C [Gouania willdenowi]|nr:uncharacterized membrane protein C19orf24 homolog [Gouania willdenowi]